MKQFKVLIIDDHPLIANAYQQALEEVFIKSDLELNTIFATTIDEAHEIIEDPNTFDRIDIVFLDIRLPKGKNLKIISGEDLGILMRKKYPKKKLVVATTFNDNYRIHSILKNIDPDGFLVKNDLTPAELVCAIQVLLSEPPFYSKTVLKMLRKQISDEALLDHTDRRLLYEISIGTKMKELPNILPLSKAGIERRKRNLRLVFEVENGSDRDLVFQAKERGFI
ncbi:response regulator [Christiangramia forsetii]|uniref:Two-component system response regulator n=2 Tax=Christiangramia forsetii TaxID=411153 RepID=A0LYJ9_CHRFK|nr:response regulator [Christiangramia forsetii]GGG34003.1 DNA-binding response regulator [Christiangramia forsetii]CAL65444.1 two-component system response regulator [Christiangramia forsetii KT0803]